MNIIRIPVFLLFILATNLAWSAGVSGPPYKYTSYGATINFVELRTSPLDTDQMKIAVDDICEGRTVCLVSFWALGVVPKQRRITEEQYRDRMALWMQVDRFKTARWEVNCRLYPELKEPLEAKCMKFKWQEDEDPLTMEILSDYPQ